MPRRDRMLTSFVLLLVLILTLSCNPNPQPEGLTPIPTLAPAATLTLIPSLEGPPTTGGETVASPASPAFLTIPLTLRLMEYLQLNLGELSDSNHSDRAEPYLFDLDSPFPKQNAYKQSRGRPDTLAV